MCNAHLVTVVKQYLYNNNYKFNIENMLVIGLLSTEQEVEEIKYIAKVCTIEDRIHFVVRMQRIKELLKKETKRL